MKVRAQLAMVMNLDKCIGCHTCSVTCKNVWTSRPGVEYAWFNNVETKPGVGYPREWEDQERWRGGWERGEDGRLRDDTSFMGSSIIDSTGVLELVSFLEGIYHITINDDEMVPENLDSLNNIDQFLKRKMNGQRPR